MDSRVFQRQDRRQARTGAAAARHYVSQYELVSFSTMPYAQIPDRIRRQDLAMALAAAGALGLGGAAVALAAAASRVTRRKSP